MALITTIETKTTERSTLFYDALPEDNNDNTQPYDKAHLQSFTESSAHVIESHDGEAYADKTRSNRTYSGYRNRGK
jgi:coproporphyrinogen III oxidase